MILNSGDRTTPSTAPAGPCFDCINQTTKLFVALRWNRTCAPHRGQFTLPASPEGWQEDCDGAVAVTGPCKSLSLIFKEQLLGDPQLPVSVLKDPPSPSALGRALVLVTDPWFMACLGC